MGQRGCARSRPAAESLSDSRIFVHPAGLSSAVSLDVGFASQTPALPGGGASMRGWGETFAPDLSTGSGTLTVPLDLPHGPNDIAPHLGLRYDTGYPNGPFGLG